MKPEGPAREIVLRSRDGPARLESRVKSNYIPVYTTILRQIERCLDLYNKRGVRREQLGDLFGCRCVNVILSKLHV